MTETTTHIPLRQFLNNVLKLFGCLSRQRKIQIIALFGLQILSALLEVVSIGAVIPFLSALTDIEKLMGNPYITQLMGITGITGPGQLIALLAILFSGAIAISNSVRFLTICVQQYLSAHIFTDLGTTLFQKTLYKPYKYFLDNNTSQLIGNTTNDLNGTLGVLHSVFTLMTQGLITISVAAGLLAYKTSLALMLCAITVTCYSLLTYFINKRLQGNSTVLSDSYRNIVKALQEGFGGIRYILMDRNQAVIANHFRDADTGFRLKHAENTVIRQAPKFFMETVAVLAICILTIFLTADGSDITAIIPLMGFLVFAAYRILPAVQQVYAAITGMLGLTTSLDRVLQVLSAPVDPNLSKPVESPLEMQEALRFDNVFFSYAPESDDEWRLDNLNFTIEAKTTVALVGHTGSGKSTVSDLILGFMEPHKGVIKVDDIDLEPSNLGAWQAGLSHVPQTIFLTDATIASNIAFGVPIENIDMDRVKEATQMAQLDEFIQTLPNQYMEEVGERGVRLSGGQRQRIGIARALYQNPSMIVFDEATSALDNKTEKDVMEAIDALKHELTIVLIAHRLSTIKNADNILLFEHGKLVDQGDYETLMKNSQAFKKLAGDLT